MKSSPLQVHLEDNIRNKIKLLAKRRKITQSQLVREYLYRGINEDLADDDPGLAIIGIGSGKKSDTALNHDQYLVAEEKASWGSE
jgi:predicted NAD-dependent protein-ADP-ribosyltransferase YbiA (DUF1768 family)